MSKLTDFLNRLVSKDDIRNRLAATTLMECDGCHQRFPPGRLTVVGGKGPKSVLCPRCYGRDRLKLVIAAVVACLLIAAFMAISMHLQGAQ